MGEPLTARQIAALPEGSRLRVTWSGGNGPWEYTLKDRGGVPWAATTDGYYVGALIHAIGPRPLTEVRLSAPATPPSEGGKDAS